MTIAGLNNFYVDGNQTNPFNNKKMDASQSATFSQIFQSKMKAPYSELADENGIIEYEGVVFVCSEKDNSLCLGDVSNDKNVLKIPLAGGGVLKVNRDNLDDLSKAIGMFSPEDVNRILRAMAQDAQVKKKEQEIEEEQERIWNQ